MTPFSISSRAGMWVANYLNFCLFEVFISLSLFQDSVSRFPDTVFLVGRLFLFLFFLSALEIHHPTTFCSVMFLLRNPLITLWKLLFILNFLILTAFNIIFLSATVDSFTIVGLCIHWFSHVIKNFLTLGNL